jgi:predicted transposase YbfD/YdcC
MDPAILPARGSSHNTDLALAFNQPDKDVPEELRLVRQKWDRLSKNAMRVLAASLTQKWNQAAIFILRFRMRAGKRIFEIAKQDFIENGEFVVSDSGFHNFENRSFEQLGKTKVERSLAEAVN